LFGLSFIFSLYFQKKHGHVHEDLDSHYKRA